MIAAVTQKNTLLGSHLAQTHRSAKLLRPTKGKLKTTQSKEAARKRFPWHRSALCQGPSRSCVPPPVGAWQHIQRGPCNGSPNPVTLHQASSFHNRQRIEDLAPLFQATSDAQCLPGCVFFICFFGHPCAIAHLLQTCNCGWLGQAIVFWAGGHLIL